MLARHQDPIVAIATAPGRGAVGIVRVSGRALAPLAEVLCGRVLQPRRAAYGPFLAEDGQPIDQGLALFFPAPHSYTGEDVLELQAHGGPVLLQLLLARCLQAAAQADAEGRARLPRLRLAEPGEFTERAFLNGKLDLAQAEAVADLIDASTEAAARSAGRSLSGAFSVEIETLRERVVKLRMLVEATLDFPEEEIDFLQQADARGQLTRITETLDGVLDRARQGALLREGIKVVLAGQPNVGKSSLLNALAGAELAIVTPIAGTTRDRVRETIQIQGVPLHVIDTAGLREEHADEVERIGIERSWQAIQEADAVIFLHDLSRLGQPDYDAAEAQIAQRLGLEGAQAIGERVLHVYNKADLGQAPEGSLALCARSGQGLDALRAALLERAGWHASPEGVFIARTRHVQALRRTREHLELAAAHIDASEPPLDLFAEELRLAHNALGEITGAFSADDLLGEIFSRFCIGK
ncbi:tRNA uridine-5-carboxymethylaminomethyl(34) synthesis GTPase MnmE [uncultured Azohydromonas sp.]|jgi:tRNA modification GTPase TrmE|uniref:tRNA uridine-5-carboxymethylaminomethyl(34) synthesis GTPase MnmE n=1 Tax=uncultured Azohydromonas sp. TaxID=487342 RepID=UPI00262997A6|nr:tRNA uridine-5-carboxymethylaminomethyl(34) synthesis GTPase MnmE [uncultured Azohydromonas sp.]